MKVRLGFVSNSSSSSFVLMHNFKEKENLRSLLIKILKDSCGIFSYISACKIVDESADRILDIECPAIRGKFTDDPKIVGYGYKKEKRSKLEIENQEFDFEFLTEEEQSFLHEYQTVIVSEIEGYGDGGDAVGEVLLDLALEYRDKDLYFKKKAEVNA